VDLRLDEEGNLCILEINSLPSLGEHGYYVAAAEALGTDFVALAKRLIEVARALLRHTSPTPTDACHPRSRNRNLHIPDAKAGQAGKKVEK
jgi:hypothetical protein